MVHSCVDKSCYIFSKKPISFSKPTRSPDVLMSVGLTAARPGCLGSARNPSFPHFFSLLASTRGDALKEELTDLQRPLLFSPPLRSRCRGKLPSAHGDGKDLQVSDISPICFIVSLSSLPSYHRHGRLHALSSACRLHASPPSPRVTSMLAQAECRFIKTK